MPHPTIDGLLIGRADEVRSIADLLGRTRLVTVVGPGGVGKTTVALEVAGELDTEIERVVLTGLADASAEHRGDTLHHLADTVLGETTEDLRRVTAALGGVPTLLVLDNCEHVIDEVAELVSVLLAGTSSLRILATSRRPIDVAGETVIPLLPLAVPVGDGPEDVAASPAARLFLERAGQSAPGFALTDANRTTVVEVVAAAGGLPLALELAAALVRSTPLHAVRDALRSGPGQVGAERRAAPAHQRTLASSVDWSLRFLDDTERRLLGRLAVFVGGFTAEGAAVIGAEGIGAGAAGGGVDVTDGLRRLVDHSLISFDPSTERYGMVEPVRLAALDRLDPGEQAEVGHRHLAWCLDLVGRIEAGRHEPDPDDLFPTHRRELPNLCAALRRALDNGDLAGARALVGPVAPWWVHHLPPAEPDELLALFDDESVLPAWRANVWTALAFQWSHRGRHDTALVLGRRAVDAYRAAGLVVDESLAAVVVGNALTELGDRVGAEEAFRLALTTADTGGHPYARLYARISLARCSPSSPESEHHLRTAHDLARDGFGAMAAVTAADLAALAARDGSPARLAEATELAGRAVIGAASHGTTEILATALCSRGEVALALGDLERALVDFTEALVLARRCGHTGLIDRAAAGADRAGEQPLRTVDGGVELSDRELAVVRLLRGDLTQREIAEELYIAPSTVKTHVKAIYRKLGVSRRSQAVTRAAELGLIRNR